MKKIFSIAVLSLLAFAIPAKSQVVAVTLISQYSATVDTADNTETIYLTVPTRVNLQGYFKSGLVVFKAQEISGTGAGTATLQVSANGTDFADIVATDSAYTILDQTGAQTKGWKVEDWYGKSLRIKITGSGTMSYKVWGSVILKN